MAGILLVDDDPAVLELSAEVLAAAGHDITRAVDGPQALALLQAGRFDALVTDNAMPGMPGRVLIEQARLLHPGLRCLLTSGYGDVAAEDDSFSVLRKPFRAAGLVAAVASLLGASQ